MSMPRRDIGMNQGFSFGSSGLVSQVEPSKEGTDFIDLDRLLGVAMRQLKVVAICALISLMLGVIYLRTTPPVYTASARVLIDDGLGQSLEEVSPLTVSLQSDAAILSQIEIIRSARLASVVVEKLQLHQNENFMSPPSSLLSRIIGQVRGLAGFIRSTPPSAPQENVSEEAQIANEIAGLKRQAAGMLQGNVIAQRLGRSYVLAIGYASHDRELAAAIADAYADAYLADQLEANFEATEQASVWLQERLAELQQNSQTAALAVEQYRAQNNLSVTRGELISGQRLVDLNSQLILAQADTARASARYRQYNEILQGGTESAAENLIVSDEQLTPDSILTTLRPRYVEITRREREISENYGEDHPQAVALRREKTGLEERILAEIRQLTQTFRNEFEIAQSRETALRESIEQASGQNAEAQQSQVRLRELEQQANALSSLYQTFLARYEEVAQQSTFPIAKARILARAEVPRQATEPRTITVLGLSLVLGLIMGGGLGVLNEFNERFFRTGDDVRNRLGAKFLGYLPLLGAPRSPRPATTKTGAEGPGFLPDSDARRHLLRAAISAPSSPFAETLRSIKIAGDVVLQRTGGKVIGIVSVLPDEGKSTVAANLAGLLSADGARTLLIDGDLRNPGLTRNFGIQAEAGLVEAVVNRQPWQPLVKVDRQSHLSLIPTVLRGRLSHTSELLGSRGMHALLDEARGTFDYIIVDLPPLGPVVDAKAFAPLADGFVVVAEWGKTPRALVRSQLEAEPEIASKMLGIVLNKVNLKKLARYGAIGSSEKFLDRYASYYLEGTDGSKGTQQSG